MDYLNGDSMIRNLTDICRVPSRLYDHLSYPLLIHMRAMYGHVNWDDFVVELDEHTIDLILTRYQDCTSYQKLKKQLKPGMKVVIVDDEGMCPATYNALLNHADYVEVLTLDDALDKAAHWYVLNLIDGYGGFKLVTLYFLLAFRLALMEGDMESEQRFLPSRLEKIWRNTYASLMWQASQKMESASIEIAKGQHWVDFDLDDYEVDEYISSLE